MPLSIPVEFIHGGFVLVPMLNWLYEDFSKGVTPVYLMDEVINSKPSIVH